MSQNYKLAIIGATGLVGRTVIKVLEERQLPISEYYFFASSKSAGQTIYFNNRIYKVQELCENSFDLGIDYAIFCAGGEISKIYAPIAVSKKCIVIDNSSAFRMHENVPLVVPEVNLSDAYSNSGIIANPNCSTIQAVVALKPLDIRFEIKRIVYSTYQAVSGAGQKGIKDLENTLKGLPSSKFPHPIFNNCIPHIDIFLDNGYTKEEVKMIQETRKILHRPNLNITATAVRVPVFNCHSEAINVEFNKNFKMSELKSILENTPGVVLQDNPSKNLYPLASNCSGKNEVFVGRLRRDFSVDSGINLWVVADNVRKGAATNAIQILEGLINENIAI